MSSPLRLAVVLRYTMKYLKTCPAAKGRPIVRRQINTPEKSNKKKKGDEVKQMREQKCTRGEAQSQG